MATFKDRIEDLAGTIPATADAEQFLKDGVIDVVHRTITAHPQHMPLFAKEESIGEGGTDIHDVHVLEVTRDSKSCREIPAGGRHAAADSSSMFYASTDDPVYYFLNEQINVLPASGTKTMSILTHGTVSNWDSGSSAISYMPEHHYNQVIMYAGIQTLHHKMVEMETDADITTAFTAMNTELDETPVICDSINTQVDNAVTEIAKAVTEAGEMITQTDNSGDFATALTAINTAVDKFRTDAADPSLFGDESTYTTGTGMTSVKTYIDRAISYINGNFPHGDYDLVANLADVDAELANEDIELASGRMQQVQTTLSAVQADIGIAQTYITEWTTMVQTLAAEIDGFSKEIQSRATFTGAKGQVVQSILGEASAYLNAAQGYSAEIQSKIAISQGYAGEAKIRMERSAQKYQWYGTELGSLQQQYNASFMVSGQQ